jgi:transcriptional regulator with XRE-family HTH domain
MKTTHKDYEPVHIGHNIRRIREIIGMKQYALADDCNWSQQQMSKLENSESVDHEHLEVIAKSLGVSGKFIENFNEEKATYYIQNNNLHDNVKVSSQNNSPVFNNPPVEEFGELLKKLLQDEQQKSQAIVELNKIVHDLAEEVKKLKSGKD